MPLIYVSVLFLHQCYDLFAREWFFCLSVLLLGTQHKLGGVLGVHVTGISHAMKRNTANGDAGLPCY